MLFDKGDGGGQTTAEYMRDLEERVILNTSAAAEATSHQPVFLEDEVAVIERAHREVEDEVEDEIDRQITRLVNISEGEETVSSTVVDAGGDAGGDAVIVPPRRTV